MDQTLFTPFFTFLWIQNNNEAHLWKKIIINLLCCVEAISVLLSDSRDEADDPPDLPRQSKQVDSGLSQDEDEEESARQTLLGQESCEVTGYEMRGVQHSLDNFSSLADSFLQTSFRGKTCNRYRNKTGNSCRKLLRCNLKIYRLEML